MSLRCLHDKYEIHTILSQNPTLHLYELGDLDDFFWPYTTWYTLADQNAVPQIALMYTETSLPVLLGMTEQPDAMRMLLQSLRPVLPRRFYAHLRPDVVTLFADDYQIESQGPHYRMALTEPSLLHSVETGPVCRLTIADKAELEQFYQQSYPGNWFVARMLETGHYVGIRQGARLVSVAGVHVYSAPYRVAALGNITTLPAFRGQGLATRTCAALCRTLAETVEHIGLNVHAENAAAIACYTKLGFTQIASFGEYILELKHRSSEESR